MTTPETLRQLQADYKAEKAKTAHMGLYIPGPASDAVAAAAPTHLADLITALERQAKVREVHKPVWTASPFPGGYICAACHEPVESEPCKTIRILDGNE